MQRVQSIDVLRGLIMVLMAIDHVRVYSGMPAGGAEAGIFFTRWITHFCAPGFVFFAGTAAFLYGMKSGDPKQLARYLFTRGLMLVVLEITIIRFFWTFNLNLDEFMLAGVIWMLGWCMVLLGVVVLARLNAAVTGITGLAIISFQQLFAYVSNGTYWQFIYPSESDGPSGIAILYVIVPWIGVMMAGYGFGKILLMEKRDKWCYIIGITSIVLFLIFGMFTSEDIFQLLNQRKYPASQLYLLMTLGPLITLIPFAGRAKGAVVDFLKIFGRVPFFYYLAHILIIHISALVVNYFLFGDVHQEWYTAAPFANVPEENRWGLGLLYFVFAIDVAILYFVSKWYASRKLKFL